MLAGFKFLPPAEAAVLVAGDIPLEQILTYEEDRTEQQDLHAKFLLDVSELDQLLSTMDDLTVLHNTIRLHGITPALLCFANHAALLSSVIPAIPTVESLQTKLTTQAGIGYPPAACSAALEGIAAKLKEMAGQIRQRIAKLVNHIHTEIQLRRGALSGVRTRLNQYNTAIKNKHYDVESAKHAMGRILRLPQLLEILDFALDVNGIAMELLAIEQPTTAVQEIVWKNKFQTVLHTRVAQYNFVRDTTIQRLSAQRASYHDAGYDETAFAEIYRKLEAYIREELINHIHLEQAIATYWRKTNDILDHLSVTYENKDGETITEYADAGHYVYGAARRSLAYINAMRRVGYEDGVMRGVRALGGLTHIYTTTT